MMKIKVKKHCLFARIDLVDFEDDLNLKVSPNTSTLQLYHHLNIYCLCLDLQMLLVNGILVLLVQVLRNLINSFLERVILLQGARGVTYDEISISL